MLPVVAAAGKTAGDAGSSEGCGAGVVTQVVPLRGAHATALHVTPTDAQACETTHARSVTDAEIVESGLRHWGCVYEKQDAYVVYSSKVLLMT